MQPTPEQQEIVEAAVAGEQLVVEAGAGTGKTSTLKLLAAAKPRQRGLYVAYNKAIADDARDSFPGTVKCKTAHALAYATFGSRYRHRLSGPRVPAREAAAILGLTKALRVGERALAPRQLARLALDTVTSWCHSAFAEIGPQHVPFVPGISDAELGVGQDELTEIVLPAARRAWADITELDGRLRFAHDHYLKMWQLSRPRLGFDYILFDEAQDANPVIADVIWIQDGVQKILVGDRCQAIYGWRGAVDAMEHFEGRRLQLSQSFRFGEAVAEEANKWLSLLGSDLKLRGFERIDSQLAELDQPRAVLCRSNAQAIAEVIQAGATDRRAALVGGGGEIRRLAEAASSLLAGIGTDHPELCAFRTWQEVQEYVVEDTAASDLKVLVRIVDRYGPDVVLRLVDRLVEEHQADVVISTAHKAKGREWDSVRIADDFTEPEPGEPIDRAEAMLAYVSVTRAKLVLDRSGLAWVDDFMAEPPRDVPEADQGGDPATDDGEDLTVTGPRESQLMDDLVCNACHHLLDEHREDGELILACVQCGCPCFTLEPPRVELDPDGPPDVLAVDPAAHALDEVFASASTVQLPPAPAPDPHLTALVQGAAEAERQYVRCHHRHAPRPPDPIECPACALVGGR